jgi:hypothetical protein
MKAVADPGISSQSMSPSSPKWTRPGWQFLLLGGCLLLTLAIRIWFTIHTRGIIEGDEALTGMQAENILRGERPIYFYSQPYMGSLEAYLMALIFAVVGPSTWALRAEPTLLSLVLVWLTWRIAGALGELARLSPAARLCFMTVAALLAAFPPSYDLIVGMRTYGGYIEVFIVMLSLLNAALRLTMRWEAGATRRELSLRWLGLGFLVGLGLWIYPLVIVGVLAAGIWIGGYCVLAFVRSWRRVSGAEKPRPFSQLLRDLLCALATLPGVLIGFAPGLYWGALNHWENIKYLVNNSGGSDAIDRLRTVARVSKFYGSCASLRVIGGALPTEPGVTEATPYLLKPALVTGLGCLAILLVVILLAFFRRAPLLVQGQRLAALPLIFAGSAALIFCASKISSAGLVHMCGPQDWAGRYSTPLLLSLPFWYATVFTLAFSWFQPRPQRPQQTAGPASLPQFSGSQLTATILVIVLLGLQIGSQVLMYTRLNENLAFQTSGCVYAPVDNDPVLAYMREKHIRYAWANAWVGNPMTFESNAEIIALEPNIVNQPATNINRIPAYTNAVKNADRASVLLLVDHNTSRPDLLAQLDTLGITYETARFLSSSDYQVDLLVITPLNRTIPVSIINAKFRTC